MSRNFMTQNVKRVSTPFILERAGNAKYVLWLSEIITSTHAANVPKLTTLNWVTMTLDS